MGDTGTVSSHLFDHSMLGTKSAFKSPFFAPMLVFNQLARMVNGDSTDPYGLPLTSKGIKSTSSFLPDSSSALLVTKIVSVCLFRTAEVEWFAPENVSDLPAVLF